MRKSGNVVVALMTLLFVCCTGCSTVATPPKSPVAHVDTTGLQDAVAIATSALQGQPYDTADHWTLISAQRIVINGCYVWRITFKPTSLLPDDPSQGIIGAGGEVFVNVDWVTKKTEILYGE